jgi:hypothetical protein
MDRGGGGAYYTDGRILISRVESKMFFLISNQVLELEEYYTIIEAVTWMTASRTVYNLTSRMSLDYVRIVGEDGEETRRQKE